MDVQVLLLLYERGMIRRVVGLNRNSTYCNMKHAGIVVHARLRSTLLFHIRDFLVLLYSLVLLSHYSLQQLNSARNEQDA